MSITYPLSMPATPPGFRQIELIENSVVGVSVSPFTGQQQVYEWPGSWWSAKIDLVDMRRADAEKWIAFLLCLHGMSGTFLAGDPNAGTAQGPATGTPLVNGAGQTGRSLITDGWTINKTPILKAGDYIQIGSGTAQRLYKNLTDANSNGSGQATFDIFPTLRESPADNAAITVANCKGVFRRASNSQPWTMTKGGGAGQALYSIAFEAMEAF
jgi:hypothetical protein